MTRLQSISSYAVCQVVVLRIWSFERELAIPAYVGLPGYISYRKDVKSTCHKKPP